MWNSDNVLVGETEMKRTLEKTRCRWEGDIKINFKLIGHESAGWIWLRIRWSGGFLWKRVWIPKKKGNLWLFPFSTINLIKVVYYGERHNIQEIVIFGKQQVTLSSKLYYSEFVLGWAVMDNYSSTGIRDNETFQHANETQLEAMRTSQLFCWCCDLYSGLGTEVRFILH